MTALETPMPAVGRPPAPAARPVWRSYGGGGLVLGGSTLLVATLVEWARFSQPETGQGLLAAYLLPFISALVILAAATVALAFGSRGSDGIVGRSVSGRIALVGYGTFFLAAQFAYLFTVHVADPAVDASVASAINLVFTVLQTLSAIVAVVAVFRARVATGAARWSLAASVAVGIIAGALSNAGAPLAVVMLGFCVSALSIALVGVTYVVGRPMPGRAA